MMNRREFFIRMGLAIPAMKTVVSFGTGLWTPPKKEVASFEQIVLMNEPSNNYLDWLSSKQLQKLRELDHQMHFLGLHTAKGYDA